LDEDTPNPTPSILSFSYNYIINTSLTYCYFFKLVCTCVRGGHIKNNKITKQRRRQFNAILRASDDQAKEETKPRGK